MLLIAKSGGLVFGPLAQLLGYIMEGLFRFTGLFGVQNIGLSIILFTFVTKLLMLPLTIKQQKFTKMSSFMNPELQAIMEKYRDKRDNESMMKMRQEQKDVYDKYGTSQSAGCLQLLIQFPIIFALYDVIRNIPTYVSSVRVYFLNVVTGSNGLAVKANMNEIKAFVDKTNNVPGVFKELANAGNQDTIIDVLNKFGKTNWETLAKVFNDAGNADLAEVITENADKIIDMNRFLGLDLASAPNIMSLAILIPILAGLTQWFSIKLSTAQQKKRQGKIKEPENNPMASMNVIGPVMSAIFCITFPAGIGIYWIAQSFTQIITQIFVNAYFDKQDINDIVAKNIEKANKKREMQGLPPKKISANANVNTSRVQISKESTNVKSAEERAEQIKKSTEMYKDSKKGSIAERAGMVQKYNDTHKK